MKVNKPNNPHPHAELIKAWADGYTIQTLTWEGSWIDIDDPTWDEHVRYRIKPEESERRKPQREKSYYTVTANGDVSIYVWHDDMTDESLWNAGNCFKTREEAEAAAKRVRAALKGEESEELKKLRKENEELKIRCENLHKAKEAAIKQAQECSSLSVPLSDGELALIKAVREVRINHVSEDGEATFSCVVTYDEKIVNAFRQIQAEQEAKK